MSTEILKKRHAILFSWKMLGLSHDLNRFKDGREEEDYPPLQVSI